MIGPMERPATPAYFITRGERQSDREGAIVAWCPWCEAVHFYGAAGGGADRRVETRLSKCTEVSASPLVHQSVDLEVIGAVSCPAEIAPRGLYLAVEGDPRKTRDRLWHRLEAGRLGLALVRTIFGRRRPPHFDVRLVGGCLHVFGDEGRWFLDDDAGRSIAEGKGFGRMLAKLFGLSLGTVSLRTLEAALGFRMPDGHRLALVNLIDRAEAGLPAPIQNDSEDGK